VGAAIADDVLAGDRRKGSPQPAEQVQRPVSARPVQHPGENDRVTGRELVVVHRAGEVEHLPAEPAVEDLVDRHVPRKRVHGVPFVA
jgi:hypothetical protein